MRYRPAGRCLTAVLGFLAFPFLGAKGQIVQGRVIDLANGNPIVLSRVSLLDTAGRPVVFTITDTQGWFHLKAPTPGPYSVSANTEFHQELTDGPFSLTANDTLSLAVGLQPSPIQLDPIVVEARRRTLRLALEGVYEREAAGIGWHFNRERIRTRPGRPVSELISLLPNVEIHYDESFGDREPVFRRNQFERLLTRDGSREVPCYPQVFLNGVLFGVGGTVPGGLSRLSLNDAEAVEVFPIDAHLPGRFYGPNARCGTVVVWTR